MNKPSRSLRSSLAPEFLRRSRGLAKGSPPSTPALAFTLLQDAQRSRVSDIHFEPRLIGMRLRFRIDGVLNDVAELTTDQARTVINQFKAIADLDPVTRFTAKDTRATVRLDQTSLDIRLALAPCHHGESLVVRLLDPKRLERSVEALGLSRRTLKKLEDWLDNVSGMFLAAGPTGSGKTTTIYALLHELKFADRAIVSIEDPVEYQIDGITQIKVDEFHHVDFAEAVKSVLRLDPDFIMLGEIRDAPSAGSAINAAISGRALLSTVHCRDAIGAVTALRNWGLPDHEIAEALVVVIAQRLVRKLCPECQHLGYLGRTGVFELWRLDNEDYDLIMSHASEHVLRERLARKSHEDLLQDAFTKALEGTTSLAEIRKLSGLSLPQRCAPNPRSV